MAPHEGPPAPTSGGHYTPSAAIQIDTSKRAPSEATVEPQLNCAVHATVQGLADPSFSDCTLRVCLDGGSTLLSPPVPTPPPPGNTHLPRGTRVREVPVCSLVVAAKSEYFKVLLTGCFVEGRRKDRVDIHVPEDGEAAFLDLLYFLYNGGLHPRLKGSTLSTLKLLALSDILDTRDCFNSCISLLKGSHPSMTPSEATLFLHLPPLLRDRPVLSHLMQEVKRCIAKGHSSLFRAPYSPRLFQLPETVMVVMLESDELDIETEDQVLDAAKAWVKHNFPETEIEVLCRVVLPRVRHLSLSPQSLLSLALWEKQLFFGLDHGSSGTACGSPPGTLSSLADSAAPKGSTWPSMPSLSTSPADDWDLEAEVASSATSAAAAEAHEASLAALLALSERCFVEYGAVAVGKQLTKYMTGRNWKAPRQACMPPSGRIYLDVPFQFCSAWEPADDDLACSAPTLVAGRWLELKAQYHSNLGTLGLWLAWHREGSTVAPQRNSTAPGNQENPECWRARCKFCVMTEASAPAYQTLHSTEASFEVEVSCWGVQGALSMASLLEETEFFFPQGALRVRADVWLLS